MNRLKAQLIGGTSSGYPSFPAGTKIVTLGDSITQDNNLSDVSGQTVANQTDGIITWALRDVPAFKHQIWWEPTATEGASANYFRGANFGIGGDIPTGVAARLTPVINTGAPIVVLLIGTNTGATDASSAVKIAKIGEILTTLTNAGKTVLIGTIFPRTVRASPTGYEISTAQMVPILETNAYIRTLNKSFNNKVFVWDAWDDLIDTTYAVNHANYGSIKPAYTKDAVHITPLGAYVAAKSLRAILRQMGGDDVWSNAWFDSDVNQTGNMLSNGEMNGTAGTVSNGITGTAATNLAISGQASGRNVTGVASVISNSKTGGQSQRLVLTSDGGAGGNANENVTVTIGNISYSSLTNNDWVSLFVKIKVSGNAQGSLGNVGAYISNNITGKYGKGFDAYSSVALKTYPNTSDNYECWIQTEPIQWVTGSAFFAYVFPQMIEGLAGSATIDIEGLIMKKVPSPVTEFPYTP